MKCQSPDNSPYLHSNFAAISSISHLAVLFNTVFKATFHWAKMNFIVFFSWRFEVLWIFSSTFNFYQSSSTFPFFIMCTLLSTFFHLHPPTFTCAHFHLLFGALLLFETFFVTSQYHIWYPRRTWFFWGRMHIMSLQHFIWMYPSVPGSGLLWSVSGHNRVVWYT